MNGAYEQLNAYLFMLGIQNNITQTQLANLEEGKHYGVFISKVSDDQNCDVRFSLDLLWNDPDSTEVVEEECIL